MAFVEHDLPAIRAEFRDAYSVIREEVSRIKKFMKKSMKHSLNISSSCRRHDDAMPPSPID